MRKNIEYVLTKDRHGSPLVSIESELGNGMEFYPADLRALAYKLLDVADQADDQDFGKHWSPQKRTETIDGDAQRELELEAMILYAEKTGQTGEGLSRLKADLEQIRKI